MGRSLAPLSPPPGTCRVRPTPGRRRHPVDQPRCIPAALAGGPRPGPRGLIATASDRLVDSSSYLRNDRVPFVILVESASSPALLRRLSASKMIERATQNRSLLVLLGLMAATLAGLLLVPPIAQDQSYHHFADQRAWLGIPNFWN